MKAQNNLKSQTTYTHISSQCKGCRNYGYVDIRVFCSSSNYICFLFYMSVVEFLKPSSPALLHRYSFDASTIDTL